MGSPQQKTVVCPLFIIEPGASATDDKGPVFQQMIHEAPVKPPAFEAIIIHRFSRFFRDGIEFGVYERKLGKHGVKVNLSGT